MGKLACWVVVVAGWVGWTDSHKGEERAGAAGVRELGKIVAVCTVLSYPSIGLGREVEGGLVLAGEECQEV